MIIRTIRDCLSGRDLVTIGPHATVEAACEAMHDARCAALVVVEDGRPVGIVSERDVVARAVCAGRDVTCLAVGEIMTPAPRTIDAGGSLAEALAVMRQGGFGHLPVLDGGRLVGMLALRDVPASYQLMLDRFLHYRGVETVALV